MIKRDIGQPKTQRNYLIRGLSGEPIEIRLVESEDEVWVYYKRRDDWDLAEPFITEEV